MNSLRLCGLVLLCSLVIEASPVKVILDTDMIGDYDDVGAMAVLHALADEGSCEILATVSSTHSNASVGTIEIINRYYGRPEIPVGAVKNDGVGGGSENPQRRSHVKYEKLLQMYPDWWRYRNANESPDATDVYRQVLAAQADGSVTVVTTGFLTNLRKLLQSAPDALSPLDGRALVKAKVRALYVMGGKAPKGREFNLFNDPASADFVFREWPTRLIVNDFWFGTYIYAGRKVTALPAGNPVRDIYAMCLPSAEKCPPAAEIIPTGRFKDNVKEGHNCFDQSCVLAAVRGPGSFFRLERGRMEMVGEKGDNLWTRDPNGSHEVMVFHPEWPRERIASEIDELMARPPKHLSVSVSMPIGWRFFSGASSEGRAVAIPHDWGIEGDFLRTKEGRFGDFATGALPWRGFGRYEATFMRRYVDSSVYLVFEGVMANPKVSVNGRDVGGWDYGYASFTLDVTRFAAVGENELVVSADTRVHASRWYPGGGIIRPVRVIEKAGLHVLPDTMCITTPVVTPERAVVSVACETTGGPTNFTFEVKSPRCWDVSDPHLYELKFLGETFRYGIRTFAWTADDGFHLNGRRVQVQGVNLHSDLGPLGMAFHIDAARRQLLLMRDMGVNAIRTSHNPPAPGFLDLCDEMGFLVWDECFDEWRGTADNPREAPWDASLKRNLMAMVKRDRNHPSVVVWSIGNEIMVCGKAGAEKGRNQLTRSRVRELADWVRAADSTRPVAMGCHPGTNGFAKDGIWDDLDLVGWNYRESYREMRKCLPGMPLVISESASAVSSSAGWYEDVPAVGKYQYFTNEVECSGYDRQAGKTLDVPDAEFYRVERDNYLAGEFVWTGIDYLGEPTPFWDGSARSSYFGACDLCGFPKDRFYLYRSHWNRKAETVRIVPNHWNWSPRKVPVYVYTSGDEAELFLNGRSLGRRKKATGGSFETTPRQEKVNEALLRRYRLIWDEVDWEPGELSVIAYRAGRPIGMSSIRTSGEPVCVKLTRDPYSPLGGELDFWRVAVVDREGVEVPNRSDRIRFSLEGAGEIVAVGNGNAHGADSFRRTDSHPLFCGQALAVVRRKGEYELKAELMRNHESEYVDGK